MRTNRFLLSARDYEGYGVYERYGYSGLGQLPDLSVIAQPECTNSLAHVPPSSQPIIKQALESMVYTEIGQQGGGVVGSATYMLGSPGTAWVSDLVARGYVVMVAKNVGAGTIDTLATADPASVVAAANCDTGSYVIVDANAAALAAAELQAASGSTASCPPGMVGVPPYCIAAESPWQQPGQSTGQCPAGTVGVPPYCAALPGQPEPSPGGDAPGTTPSPGGATQAAALPSWVWPVAIGGSLLAITTAIVIARKR